METLILELCTVLGYCLEPDDHARLLRVPTDDVDRFTRAAFEAEGLEEPFDKSEWRNVNELVARHFA